MCKGKMTQRSGCGLDLDLNKVLIITLSWTVWEPNWIYWEEKRKPIWRHNPLTKSNHTAVVGWKGGKGPWHNAFIGKGFSSVSVPLRPFEVNQMITQLEMNYNPWPSQTTRVLINQDQIKPDSHGSPKSGSRAPNTCTKSHLIRNSGPRTNK